MVNKSSPPLLISYGLPASVFLILLVYSYAKLFIIPYVGFDIHPSDGRVIGIYTNDRVEQSLQIGDRLLKAGAIDFKAYQADLRQPLFERLYKGDIIRLTIERKGREYIIAWVVPGPTSRAILDRLDTLWLPYLFWAAGTATLLLVRPKDIRWRALVAFFYITALWLAIGNVSTGSIWHSAIIMRMLIWLCVPVYLHLHWVFPRPLSSIPTQFFRVVYLGAVGLAVLEWYQLLPPPTYIAGLILALGGSLALLAVHAFAQPDQRNDLKLLAVTLLVIVLPAVILGTITANLLGISMWFGRIGLLIMPAVPGAYFYVIYRRQLGGLELRANRIITLYLLLMMLFLTFTLVFLLINQWIVDRGLLISIEAILALVAGLTIAITYQNFQRFIERRLLGIPLPPTGLLESYAYKITTSLDLTGLVHLLREEILPSMLVRQSTLIQLNKEKSLSTLYKADINERELPTEENIPSLVEQAGRYIPSVSVNSYTNPLKWVRVVLPLEIGGKLNGLWLLGSRDPDDYYAHSEISVLQAIANQTAIALANITQAERLHALYQANIERQEKERANLALGLHDEVLNQLAALGMRQEKYHPGPGFEESHKVINDYLRGVIVELRPTMLAYGLKPALDELFEQLSKRLFNKTEIQIDLPDTEIRYDPQVELHVFRIVQQACENALRHSQARNIRIHGEFDEDGIQLVVEDDGVGFSIADSFDLTKLLRAGHYGLVGMYERAGIIAADMNVKSEPGNGTQVEVNWSVNG